MAKVKKESVLRDWKAIATAVAIIASGWASVRGEQANDSASSANSKAETVKVETRKVGKEADDSATAVLAVLNQRMATMEDASRRLRLYLQSSRKRQDHLEKMVWELYRFRYGAGVTKRVIDLVPKVTSSPEISIKRAPIPKSAAAARARYRKACAKGDPLCASPLKK